MQLLHSTKNIAFALTAVIMLFASDLLAQTGVTEPGDLLDLFYRRPERRYWAGHSGLVFDLAVAGDAPAIAIVERAATALATVVGVVGDRLDLRTPVVLGGGLLVNQPLLRERVTEQLDTAGYSDIRTLSQDPVFGALALAREMVASS